MVGRVAETEGGAILDFHRLFPWDVMSGESKGRVIRTWHDHACARYLSNAIPEAMWPASFVNALTWALASEITRAANASDSDADYRMKQAQAAFEAAKLADVRDNGDGYRIPGDWVLSRRLYCGWGVN